MGNRKGDRIWERGLEMVNETGKGKRETGEGTGNGKRDRKQEWRRQMGMGTGNMKVLSFFKWPV